MSSDVWSACGLVALGVDQTALSGPEALSVLPSGARLIATAPDATVPPFDTARSAPEPLVVAP
jgi:hypothetical protein